MPKKTSPNIYYQTLNQHRAAQLLLEAIKLDIFSYLDNAATAAEIAEKNGFDEKKTELLLLALFSCGNLEKYGNKYCNTEESKAYLSTRSPYYLGKTILFREKMTSLEHIADVIKNGSANTSTAQHLLNTPNTPAPPKNTPLNNSWYDFSTMAETAVPEMYATGRAQSFVTEVRSLFTDTELPLKMLDLGGGSGVLAMEFAKNYPGSKAYIFESPDVAETTLRIMEQHSMDTRVTVITGDFNKDDIGGPYDLIVASGILDFATGDIKDFIKRIAAALNPDGYLLFIGRYRETEDYPVENILNWLSGYMDGIKLPPTRKQVELALDRCGLETVRKVQSGQFQGYLYRKADS